MMRSSKQQRSMGARLYEICETTEEGVFQPLGGMFAEKGEAIKALRETQREYPKAYLAEVSYSRVAKSKERGA